MIEKSRVAVYPGTFDPITLGHLDIIERASKLFDTLIISIAVNSEKKPLFSTNGRLEMIKEAVKHIPNAEIDEFSGLLVEYAEKVKAVAIIRGIRALSDYEYEFKMSLMNRSLNEKITTLFLVAHQKYTHLSSALVQEVAHLGGDVTDLVPSIVAENLKKKYVR